MTPLKIGPVEIECPACEQQIPVPVVVELTVAPDGSQMLECNPDMVDLWAHAWTHTDSEEP